MVETSLDRFIKKRAIKTFFFMTKRSRLAIQNPDFKWSGFKMPVTGIKLNLKTEHGPVFGISLYRGS